MRSQGARGTECSAHVEALPLSNCFMLWRWAQAGCYLSLARTTGGDGVALASRPGNRFALFRVSSTHLYESEIFWSRIQCNSSESR